MDLFCLLELLLLVNDFLLNETFKIPNLNTFHQLFRHAEARLLSLPPGSKVFRIDHWKREEEAFKEDTEELINTPSSFLRIQGAPDVVMLASGTHRILGEGSSAQVKLAIDKTGCLYAVKIFKPPKSLLQRKQVEAFQEEHRKLQEFKIACGDSFFSQLPFRVKLYSVQHYLGNQLEEFLISAPNLSFKMRIKLAVAVCKCVHQLHAGILIKTFPMYILISSQLILQ